MYNKAQVVIDLEEYDELKKKVAAFEAGDDNKREDYLLTVIADFSMQLSNAGKSAIIKQDPDFGIGRDDTVFPPKLKLIELNK